MTKFKEGDSVVVTVDLEIDGVNCNGAIGKVKKVYDKLDIVLVEFSEGLVEKVHSRFLEPFDDPLDYELFDEMLITRRDFDNFSVLFTSLKFANDLLEDEGITEIEPADFVVSASLIFATLEELIFKKDTNDSAV
jgi:hypothetical protein